ncbi:hypothetical protein [Nonomuraea lactucae]|uniref:hypothetical protein n=1 Tax=Nonomuraea lactucae TaxID=2249762 RepID=UPI0013B3A9DD|nr:hypothetical protein [Nonomuraea lactucae]
MLLILAGVAVAVAQRKPPSTASRTTPTGSRSTPTGSRSTPAATGPTGRTPAPKATPTSRRLAGGPITLYEHPSDPVRLTSYELYDKKSDEWVDYARRSLSGPFTKYAGNWESRVSPDGRYLAVRGRTYTSDDHDSILVTDRRSGTSFSVKTVRDPLISSIRAWSRDSSKILLNIEKKVKAKNGEHDWIYPGFVIIDVAGAKAQVKIVPGGSTRTTGFGWDSEEAGVVNVAGDKEGLRFYDASGKYVRELANVGPLPSGTQDIFSPSGELFVTDCPRGGGGDHCVWDTGTGEKVHAFSSDCDKVLGWYDETRVYCWEQDNSAKDEIQVVGFDGKLVRRLLDTPGDLDLSPVFTANPTRGS